MEWTPAKLRYLLAFHTLAAENAENSAADSAPTVRCIDIAVHLGISRASVSRMLAQFVDDGILLQTNKSSFFLTELGRQESEHYNAQFESLFQLFRDQLKLSDYDARECAVTLITSLPSHTAPILSLIALASIRDILSSPFFKI